MTETPCGLKNLKYLLSGLLQKKFAKPWYSHLILHFGVEGQGPGSLLMSLAPKVCHVSSSDLAVFKSSRGPDAGRCINVCGNMSPTRKSHVDTKGISGDSLSLSSPRVSDGEGRGMRAKAFLCYNRASVLVKGNAEASNPACLLGCPWSHSPLWWFPTVNRISLSDRVFAYPNYLMSITFMLMCAHICMYMCTCMCGPHLVLKILI